MDNNGIMSAEALAWCYVNTKECFENPGKWMINKKFKLEGDKSIYIK